MNIALRLIELYCPGFIKKKKLIELTTISARAFQCEAPQYQGLAFDQCLHHYARFTKEQVERFLNNSVNIDALKARLFQEAFQLGQELRKDFRIVDPDQVMVMMKIIYHLLGIEMRAISGTEVLIEHCFFSQYYCAQVCEVISALDQGLAAGLSDGGELSFYQRITAGRKCCKAHFKVKEALT